MTLSYRRERLVRIKAKNEQRIARLLANGKVDGPFSSEVEEIRRGSVRLRTPQGPLQLPNDYVFVLAGGEPPFELLRRIGLRFGGEAAERTAC